MKQVSQITIDGIVYNCTPAEASVTPVEEKKLTKEERFKQLIEGIDINHPVVDFEKYPNSMFWFKGNECLFEYDFKNEYFWCKYSSVWSVFEKEYRMSHDDIQSFIKGQVEEGFKVKGITPRVGAF